MNSSQFVVILTNCHHGVRGIIIETNYDEHTKPTMTSKELAMKSKRCHHFVRLCLYFAAVCAFEIHCNLRVLRCSNPQRVDG